MSPQSGVTREILSRPVASPRDQLRFAYARDIFQGSLQQVLHDYEATDEQSSKDDGEDIEVTADKTFYPLAKEVDKPGNEQETGRPGQG